jgi:hypothetical protein
MSNVMPPIPTGLSMPFYYASLQTHWLYFPVDLELSRKALSKTGCEPYVFSDLGTAVAVLNFQRYTSTASSYLGTTVEVELNILAFPRSERRRVASSTTLSQYLYGEDYQKVIGPFRLHVPASNPGAVTAGRELFGEPKFVSFFVTAVPSLNDPPPNSPIRRELRGVTFQPPSRWQYSVQTAVRSGGTKDSPTFEPGPAIYTLEIDLDGLAPIGANATEMVEYGHLGLLPPDHDLAREGFAWTDEHPRPSGALVGGRWNLFGVYSVSEIGSSTPYSLTFGPATGSSMMLDMQRLLGGRRPVAVGLFESPPAAAESRAFYVRPDDEGEAR